MATSAGQGHGETQDVHAQSGTCSRALLPICYIDMGMHDGMRKSWKIVHCDGDVTAFTTIWGVPWPLSRIRGIRVCVGAGYGRCAITG